jgi:hypothetical protein
MSLLQLHGASGETSSAGTAITAEHGADPRISQFMIMLIISTHTDI